MGGGGELGRGEELGRGDGEGPWHYIFSEDGCCCVLSCCVDHLLALWFQTINNIDVQSIEPIDQNMQDSLSKSVQMAIEIATK